MSTWPPTGGSTGAIPEGQGLGRGSCMLSPHPTSPPIPLSSPPSLVPQASAAPVTDPQAGLAWALGCPGSRASGPAVAREAVSVLGTNSCRPGSSPTHPRAGVPPMAQPSLPRASPRGRGAPCPHVLALAQGMGGAWAGTDIQGPQARGSRSQASRGQPTKVTRVLTAASAKEGPCHRPHSSGPVRPAV